MQSWSTQADHRNRGTDFEPSKSGMVGLIANALGLRHDQPVDALSGLEMAVRIDRPGRLQTVLSTPGVSESADSSDEEIEDFCRASWGIALDPKKIKKSPITSARLLINKTYLAGACFVVGFSGDRDALEAIQESLILPRRPIFLGRKNCLPSRPLYVPDGVNDEPLVDRIKRHPFSKGAAPNNIRFVLERSSGSYRKDVPVGPLKNRRFTSRAVVSLPLSGV